MASKINSDGGNGASNISTDAKINNCQISSDLNTSCNISIGSSKIDSEPTGSAELNSSSNNSINTSCETINNNSNTNPSSINCSTNESDTIDPCDSDNDNCSLKINSDDDGCSDCSGVICPPGKVPDPRNNCLCVNYDPDCLTVVCPPGQVADPTNNCKCTDCAQKKCPPGQQPDPQTCACTPEEQCLKRICRETDQFPALGNIIYGYVFYLNSRRLVNIPDIGSVMVGCAGGHGCSRTLFRPQLKTKNGKIYNADKNVSLDNAGGAHSNSQIPVPDNNLAKNERSDTFTIAIDDGSEIQNASILLECQYDFCHSNVTFVVLVADNLETNQKIMIFNSCIPPGSVNTKPIKVIECREEPSPPPCPEDIEYACYYTTNCLPISIGGPGGIGWYLNDPTCNGECVPPPPPPTTVPPTTVPPTTVPPTTVPPTTVPPTTVPPTTVPPTCPPGTFPCGSSFAPGSVTCCDDGLTCNPLGFCVPPCDCAPLSFPPSAPCPEGGNPEYEVITITRPDGCVCYEIFAYCRSVGSVGQS